MNVCKLEAAEAFAGGGRNGNQDLNCQDVAMFDFTSMYAADYAARYVKFLLAKLVTITPCPQSVSPSVPNLVTFNSS